MSTRPRPRFVGVKTYKDSVGRFTFRYPTGWHQFELEDERDGVMFAPSASDPQTYFAVWATRLETEIVLEDLDDLRAGIEEGFSQLPEYAVEEAKEDTFGNLLKFERLFTFREGETLRKRRIWIMYAAKWQIVVVFQGETPEEYHHWLPMGNYSFNTFTLPPELWFATDRELNPGSAAEVAEVESASQEAESAPEAEEPQSA
jgi:hypothetical protein